MKVWRVWGGAIDRGEEDRKWWMDEQQTRVELFEERRAGTEGRRVTNRGMVGQRGGVKKKRTTCDGSKKVNCRDDRQGLRQILAECWTYDAVRGQEGGESSAGKARERKK